MTEVAGEVADGLLVHPFTTERYLREVTMPALERGLAKSGHSRSDVQIAFTGMVVAADTRAQIHAASSAVRKQIAFYGSTPAYRGVLDLSGWGDLQPRLNELSRVGEWDAMADLIDDDVVDAFSVVAPLDQVANRVTQRFGGVIDRFGLYENELIGDAAAVDILHGFRAIS